MTQTEKALAAAKKTNVATIFDFMKANQKTISNALPNAITAERLTGILTMVIKGSPALLQCSQNSLVAALVQCCQVGLFPGPMGHIYFIPFRNKGNLEVQTIIGYKGLCELINRSGQACILSAECVFENDGFEYEQGLNPVLRHVPDKKERGAFKGVYAIAKNLIANEKTFIFLEADDVEKVKKISVSKIDPDKQKYSPWITWPEEMAKKTAVRRLSKLLPLSADIQAKISADETIKTNIDKDMVQVQDKTDWDFSKEKEAAVDATATENQPSSDTSKAQSVEPDASQEAKDEEEMPEKPSDAIECSNCGAVVSEKVAKFSKDKFGKELCFSCQKKFK